MRAGSLRRSVFLISLLLFLVPAYAIAADGVVLPGSSIKTVEGVTVVTLAGSPRDIGRQHIKLLADRIPQTEAAFKKLMPKIPGGFVGRWLVRQFIMAQVRRIENHLTPDELAELKGMAENPPDGSGTYRNILYYHVLQDIGQNYACTGAAVAGNSSKQGRPLAGRNFDLDSRSLLEPVKTVFFYKPDKGFAFASVSWPGMVGAVSGMNEKGLCMMVFSAKSENTRLTGVPVAFLARRVLQGSSDVEDAIELLKHARRMGPYTFLLADKKRVAAVEMDAEKIAVRETDDGRITVGNHFVSEAFAGDHKNRRQARYSDSRQRFERIGRLINGPDKVGLDEMLRVLRDKEGPDGGRLAWGDYCAINNVKDAHSVIFDTAGMRFWVSTPPYAYGKFIGFRLSDAGLEEISALPADAFPDTQEGRSEAASDMFTVKAEEAFKDGSDDEAAAYARKAMDADKDNYLAALILGDLHARAGNFTEAFTYYNAAANSAPGEIISKARALAGRGEALFHLGKLDGAKRDYDTALGMDCSEETNDICRKGLRKVARKSGSPEVEYAGAHGGGL